MTMPPEGRPVIGLHDHVISDRDGMAGDVIAVFPDHLVARFADGTSEQFPPGGEGLRLAPPLPPRAAPPDPIQAAALHSVIRSGAAVTALHVIRDAAENVLGGDDPPGAHDLYGVLHGIRAFCDVVIRHTGHAAVPPPAAPPAG